MALMQRLRWPRSNNPVDASPIMIEPAPAKLNLALHLRRRRPDGYHDLESIFAFTDFGDRLTVTASASLTLALTGEFAAVAGDPDDNLVRRAARALAAAAGIVAGAALVLEKHIPVAAGLGGGSADAAAALRLLNRHWGLHWPQARLLAIAQTLGADVPACVVSQILLATGRGDLLSQWLPALTGTPVLLVNPRVAVPTGPVFAGWDGIDHGGIDDAAPLANLRNDMTAAALRIAPVIADVLAALTALPGATLVRMSGSGATCLALFDTPMSRDQGKLRLADCGWWLAATTLR